MRAEIVSVGSELLLGQIVDTNAAHIARQLAALGLDLFHKTTVGDNLGRVAAALETALERADVVFTTGGLGPTEDDVTREAVAVATGRELEFHQDLLTRSRRSFERAGCRCPPRTGSRPTFRGGPFRCRIRSARRPASSSRRASAP
jgi:nicotinamide-nucleotide amidase